MAASEIIFSTYNGSHPGLLSCGLHPLQLKWCRLIGSARDQNKLLSVQKAWLQLVRAKAATCWRNCEVSQPHPEHSSRSERISSQICDAFYFTSW